MKPFYGGLIMAACGLAFIASAIYLTIHDHSFVGFTLACCGTVTTITGLLMACIDS